jgi:hypothetical protein
LTWSAWKCWPREPYDNDDAALTDLTLCRIPTEVVHKLNHSSPRMHAGLLDKWQKAPREADDWLVSFNFGTARQRDGSVNNIGSSLSSDHLDWTL